MTARPQKGLTVQVDATRVQTTFSEMASQEAVRQKTESNVGLRRIRQRYLITMSAAGERRETATSLPPKTSRRTNEMTLGTTASNGTIDVLHFGLGPIGLEVARLAQERDDIRSVAAVDNNESFVGRDLGDLLGSSALGIKVADSVPVALGAAAPQVVLHATGSSLNGILPQLLACIEAGLSVVSTCEELSYPWQTAPAAAWELDTAARDAGVTILGTGVNPGFAMDYLPIVLSGASRSVSHVKVHRVQDAGQRREALQNKVGAGLDVATFQDRVRAGGVRHVGLPESAYGIAQAFGWRLTQVDDTIDPILSSDGQRNAGSDAPVAGVRQRVTGFVGEREVVSLTLEMAVGLPDPRDEVALSGNPDVRLTIPGGLHGDIATAAVVVNAIRRVSQASPGLATMADLPPPHAIGN